MVRNVRENAVNAAAAAVRLFVAAYYRMSSDDQAGSIEQQQKDVRGYAARQGWTIVREYIDSGKSGSKDVHKRKAFAQMIADSANGDWSAILVYDTSRFGRLDTLQGAPYKDTLRNNGVHLRTTKGEVVDWSTSMGRIMDALQSENNNSKSLDLSRDAIRGHVDSLEQGYWPHGPIPYGYDRQLWDGSTVAMVVPRTKSFRKPPAWRLKLIINETEAAIVRYLYETIANEDVSLLRFTGLVALKGPSPRASAAWGCNAVLAILNNPVYCGDITIGQRQKQDKGRGKFNRAEALTNKDAAPAIVSRELWEQVQKLMRKRKAERRHPTRRGATDNAALSGILCC